MSRGREPGNDSRESRDHQHGDVCRKVIAEIGQADPERVVSLRIEGDDSGNWDAARMAQVLSNLVGNAIQYSPLGTAVDVRLRGSSRTSSCSAA